MSCGTASQVPRQGAEDSILEISSLPSEAYFHFLRGYLAELAKEPDRAIEEYQIGLEYDPESLFLRTRMAQLYFSNGEMASAVAMVKGIDPDRVTKVSTLLQVARIYAGAGYQERALTFYTRAIELTPNHVKSYLSKGRLLITLKRFEEAKQVFEKPRQSRVVVCR